MSYEHDLFISYRREHLWTGWTRDHFKKMLTSYLQQELGCRPDIFVDERIEVGSDWVDELAKHLARSRVMVAVLSGDYLASQWCIHEMDMMLDRDGGRAGLVIPVVVHDCHPFPPPLARQQATDLSKFRLTHMNKKGQLYEDFSGAIKSLAPAVAQKVRTAPSFDPMWEIALHSRFNDVFAACAGGSPVAPVHFRVPARPSFTQPRLAP